MFYFSNPLSVAHCQSVLLLFLVLCPLSFVPQSINAFEILGIKDGNLYFKGLDANAKYQVEQEGVINSRKVTADECGIVKMRNSSKYPIIANGNYFDIYFQEKDYWYYWTTFTHPSAYPKLKCKKVGADFIVEANIYNAIDGTGSQSFVVFHDFIQIYHPQIIKPNSQHTVIWYGEWTGNNYVGHPSLTNLSVNSCGVGKLNLGKFRDTVWNFTPGEFTFTLKKEGNQLGTFDPAQQEIKFKPICKQGVLFEPTTYF